MRLKTCTAPLLPPTATSALSGLQARASTPSSSLSPTRMERRDWSRGEACWNISSSDMVDEHFGLLLKLFLRKLRLSPELL